MAPTPIGWLTLLVIVFITLSCIVSCVNTSERVQSDLPEINQKLDRIILLLEKNNER